MLFLRNRCVSVAKERKTERARKRKQRKRKRTEFARGTIENYIRGLAPFLPLVNTMSGFVENFCGLLTPVFPVHSPCLSPFSPVHFVPQYPTDRLIRHWVPIGRFPFPIRRRSREIWLIKSLDVFRDGALIRASSIYQKFYHLRDSFARVKIDRVSPPFKAPLQWIY